VVCLLKRQELITFAVCGLPIDWRQGTALDLSGAIVRR
jgi:hypothetical protein